MQPANGRAQNGSDGAGGSGGASSGGGLRRASSGGAFRRANSRGGFRRASSGGALRRTWLLQFGLLGWALAIWGRLFALQVLDYHFLERVARRQQSRLEKVQPRRGLIFDRHLHPLAMSLQVDSVFAIPRRITHPRAEARALAAVLGLDARELRARLGASRGFCWVARKITADQSRRLRALHLPGIYFQKESKRFYPKQRLAAQVLGYVGMDGHGLGGLEFSFNRQLAGRPGRELIELDAHGRPLQLIEQAPHPGRSYVLTLDEYIQYIAQQQLDQAMKKTRAMRGAVVIERPQDGELLAVASAPDFNPNHIDRAPPQALGDVAVSDVFEPGSTFKLVTLSAALNEHLATPSQIVNCQMGAIRVGGVIIHDHKPFGELTVTQILAQSSDVGAIKLGLRLGPRRLYRYIRAYGFGQRTGVPLPGESAGILRPPRLWSGMSIGALSMGQEVAATPLQVASLFATIADDGVEHRPQLVLSSFAGPRPERRRRFAPPAGRRVVSARVAEEMKLMMEQVVLDGTAPKAQLPGYSSGGKTGTAQMVMPGAHVYARNHYVAWFGGITPLNNPAVVILVMLENPIGLHDGGTVCAPVFRHIAERILPYMGVPRDLPLAPGFTEAGGGAAPPHGGPKRTFVTPPGAFRREAEQAKILLARLDNGGRAAAGASGGDSVVLDYTGGERLPDWTGKSVRQVVADCQRLGLDPRLLGSGLARRQSPPPGAGVRAGQQVIVEFSRRPAPASDAASAAGNTLATANAAVPASATIRAAAATRRRPRVQRLRRQQFRHVRPKRRF